MSTFKAQLTQSVLALALILNLPLSAHAEAVKIIDGFDTIYSTGASPVAVVQDQICLSGDDNSGYGNELWCYDGVNPPRMVGDINPGSEGSSPRNLTAFNGKLYFSAYRQGYSRRMWVYDGINPPEMMRKTLPVPKWDGHSFMGHVFKGKFYFSAKHREYGQELWVYDGVNHPTLVQDLNPEGDSAPRQMITFNGRLYFTAYDSPNSPRLWSYDGENPASIVAADNPNLLKPSYYQVYRNKLYFSAYDAEYNNYLWSYDGYNPPVIVASPPKPLDATNKPFIFKLTVFDDKLYFRVSYRTSDSSPSKDLVGVYDAERHTMKVVSDPALFGAMDLIAWQDKLYFTSYTQQYGMELWSYDGKSPSIQVADVKPGSVSGWPRYFIPFQDKLYMIVNIGNQSPDPFVWTEVYKLASISGDENWVDEGSEGGGSEGEGSEGEMPTIEAPACQVYGVHDDGLNDSQLFKVVTEYHNVTTILDEYANVVTMADAYYNVVTLGDLHFDFDIEGLDLHPNDKDLYASSGDDTDAAGVLYKVDTENGDLTALGATGFAEVDAISFNPVDASLWGWAQGEGLIQINPATGQGNLMMAYAGEIEGLTWDDAGAMLYAVENLHEGDVDAQHDNQGVRLWRYNASNGEITEACQPDAFDSEVEALEALEDGSLLFTYHGYKAIHIGVIIFTAASECDVFEIEPISTPFNDIEGLAYPQSCMQ